MRPDGSRPNGLSAQPEAPSLAGFLLALLVIAIGLISAVAWVAYENGHVADQQARARASFARQMGLVDLISSLKDAETSQRGFIITGDDDFLAPYPFGKSEAFAGLARLRDDYRESSVSQARVDVLGRAVAAKFAEMDRAIATRRVEGLSAAAAIVANGRGMALMGRARAIVAEMLAAEQRLGNAELSAYRARQRDIEWLTQAGSLILALGVLVSVWLLWSVRRARYRSEVAAHEAATRQRAIVDSTNDAILTFNPSGTIETVNAAGRRLLGIDAQDSRRRDVSTVLDIATGSGNFHERIGLIDGRLRQSILAGRQARRLDGTPVPVDISLGLMDLPEGVHIVASLRDMTERTRLEQLKDDLISTVSHELRTPLTSVVGALGLLRAGAAGDVEPQAAKLVEIAENNSRRLIRLINDMLDIDRIESGKLRMERSRMDLAALATRAAQDADGLASSSGVAIGTDLPTEPVWASVDEGRLLQVLGNLLSNAIKATPAGRSVTLRLEIDSGRARLAVDDEGPGIPQEFRERVFGRFEQSRDSQASGSGSGLGLAISREIVLRHGGAIWFEDRLEGGTRFAFTLDIEDPDAQMAKTGDLRILICEDDRNVALTLREMAVEEGFSCDTAATGAEARAMLRFRPYEMLLLDLNLPDESGLELARSIRAHERLHDLPIVMVTGAAPLENEEIAALNLVDWIVKPVSLVQLSAALRSAARRSGKERPVVLHLDDDQDTLEVTSSALSPEAQMLKAPDLATARSILKGITPDLAIIDVNLPVGSGIDLLPQLVDGKGVPIPVIIYSAHGVGAETAERVDAVLVKAQDSLPDLRRTIRRLAAASEQRAEG